jgi:myo-inositol-1(or 4)-monophosphatase
MNKKWHEESSIVLKAISSAASILEENSKSVITFNTKESNRDVVTELDLAIEEYLKKELSVSGHYIIGEETGVADNLDSLMKKPVWFLDPIDGTTNFISGIPLYCISAGLVADFDFVAGAVILPALKEIYFIAEGSAYMNGKSLKVHSCDLKNALTGMAFSGYSNDKKKRSKEYETFGQLNDLSRGCLRTGSAAINICYVAAGRLNAVLGIKNKIWDVAGAIAIAAAAGCHIYIEWIKDTPCINYIVGSPGASEELKLIITDQGLADLQLLISK